jgi:Holliday junction resolvase RusA-like endonuclease
MTEHKISFIVPGEPVPMPRPRTVHKGGKTWTFSGNKKSKDYMKAIKAACKERYHFDDAMVKILLYTEKRHDLDNVAKAVLDALTDVLWDDDKIVWSLSILRLGLLAGEPATEVEVIGEEPTHMQAKL